jgi:hypothetical protein
MISAFSTISFNRRDSIWIEALCEIAAALVAVNNRTSAYAVSRRGRVQG